MFAFGTQCASHSESVILNWIPHYTAFGLIFGTLQPLFFGASSCVFSALSFVKRPARWLQAITNLKATQTAAPNFAYDLCVREITHEQRSNLDLSSLLMTGNGAEMVHAATLESFTGAYAPFGFRPETFCPVFGLSEAMVVTSRQMAGAGSSHVKTIEPAEHVDSLDWTLARGARAVVSCGNALAGSQVVVVNPETLIQCGENEIGEVWASNKSVSCGYWQKPEATAHVLKARRPGVAGQTYLRTGDLGLIRDGEIFLTCRMKDLIISRGQNHFPEDIEQTIAQRCSILPRGGSAAFSIEVGSEEQLIVMAEVAQVADVDFTDIITGVRQAIIEYHGLQVYALLLFENGKLPRNRAHEIDRKGCRSGFVKNALTPLAEWRRSVAENVNTNIRLDRDALLKTSAAEREQTLLIFMQEQVANLMSLAPKDVDLNQSLIRLGIDSLLTIELKNRIKTAIGAVIPMTDFLAAPTIRDLTRQLAESLANDTLADFEPALSPETAGVPFALSYNQRSLWFLNQLAPESAAYNVPFVLRVRSDLDIAALERALHALVTRHPSLRTVYGNDNDEPFQLILESGDFEFEQHNASTLNRQQLRAELSAEANRPFDLANGPMLRAGLWIIAPKDHVLMLSIHHIAIDYWSLEILINELGVLYEAENSGAIAALPVPRGSYSEHVAWQLSMLRGARGDQLWSYWQTQLAGQLPLLNLPTDRSRPPVQTYRGASQTFTLNSELTTRLKALAQAENTTLYMVLLAIFSAWLNRYTGQKDILVGSPAAGRNRTGQESVVGYFVNPIVLRTDFSAGPNLKTLLAQVRERVLGALKHQDFPFPLIVERLQLERDPSRSPIFQAMFVLEKPYRPEDELMSRFVLGEAGAHASLGGLQVESFALEDRKSQFDLMLMMVETGGAIFATMPYNSDLFDAATAARMAEHFENFLVHVVDDPELPIARQPLMSDEEQRRLLIEWNDTQQERPESLCIHHLFEQQVDKTPDAIALVFQDRQLTYRELNASANQLAHALLALGVGPETTVGICVERSLEMAIAVLATLKAGGAYVPLDPSYPKARLAFMLENADVLVVLTQERLRSALPPDSVRLVCVENIAESRDDNPITSVVPQNLAYIIYTSGSTGQAKGVMISHESAVNLAFAHQHAIYNHQGPKTLRAGLNAPLSFDGSVERLLLLLFGHTIHIFSEALRHDPEALLAYAERHEINVLDSTPAQMKVLIEAGLLTQRSASVSLVIIGGEQIPESLWRWLAEYTPITFFNVYGPTECTVNAAVCKIETVQATPVIGRPLPNVRVYILDEQRQPMPVGVPGEVYVGGQGVARGYLANPALTAERFIPDPFGASGARLYRTFDLARYQPDGNIEFLGRIDHQVKIRGYRIELGEIEAALRTHPALSDVLVMTAEDVNSEKSLVAYVVSKRQPAPEVDELRRFLKERLPVYMTPSEFAVLDSLPVSSNGKLDLKALPTLSQIRSETRDAYLASRTASERMLASIWSELLRREPIGIYDNFFELGGHSILATQLVMRIRQLFEIDLPLSAIFESVTLADLNFKILQHQLQPNDDGVDAMIEELEHLSEDEVRTLLES